MFIYLFCRLFDSSFICCFISFINSFLNQMVEMNGEEMIIGKLISTINSGTEFKISIFCILLLQ